MKRKVTFRTTAMLIALFAAFNVNAKKDSITPVDAINTLEHLDKYVVVEGLVTQYTPESPQATAYYILKGDYGTPMRVNTSSKKPTINRKYRVKGIVKADEMKQPYIVEVKKKQIIPLWIFITVGAILVIILVVVLILILGGKRGNEDKKAEKAGYDDSLKTVKIVKDVDSNPTLMYIPGKLKILNGDDKGRELVLAGCPSGDGGVVTVGSREETGVKKLCHIQLMEKTVSKKQAEIIYHKYDKKVLIKNLSKVNYTKLNGEELHEDEAKEMKIGDKITMGELEFEYIA